MALAVCCSLPTAAQSVNRNFEIAKNLEIFSAIYKTLEMGYVDSLQSEKVIKKGIDAMLSNLDPYTVYYPADNKDELVTMLTGKFGGIGSLITYNFKLKRTVINEPYEGMPAALAGLKKGDIIMAIDGKDMLGKDTKAVSDRLRGEAGTTFELTCKRPTTGQTFTRRITRAVITQAAVPYYGLINPTTGYLALTQFTEGCADIVRKALVDMKQKGMKQLVFDLRGNGGGSEQEAVKTVACFVEKGTVVVSNRNMKTGQQEDYATQDLPVDTQMPVVVLVNGNTASAGEIVSGALQDLDRAVIMGTRTFGKGLVQSTTSLPYGGMMKFTTYHYYIPSGRCIQAINYTQGNRTEASYVPDSLTHTFFTRKGREVKDGGGIRPDLEVKPDTLPYVAYDLMNADTTQIMLDYAVDYAAKHPTIAPPETFAITEADFQDFKQYVLQRGWTRQERSIEALDNVKKIANMEGTSKRAEEVFKQLKTLLKPNMSEELEAAKEDIKLSLAMEIVPMYYYERGAVRNALNGNKEFEAAMSLLNTPDRYTALLQKPTAPASKPVAKEAPKSNRKRK